MKKKKNIGLFGELQEQIKLFQTGVAKEWWDGSFSVDDLVVKPVN